MTTVNTDNWQAFRIHNRRCTVCRHAERDNIDMMLLGEERNADDQQMSYEEILSFAAASGPTISNSSLSRHYVNHVKPSWRQMLETQQQMDAIAKATGRSLTMPSVLTNIIISKGVRYLDELTEDKIAELDPHKFLRILNEAARNAMHLERAEALLTKQQIDDVDAKLTDKLSKKGLDTDTIATIRQELYGLAPREG